MGREPASCRRSLSPSLSALPLPGGGGLISSDIKPRRGGRSTDWTSGARKSPFIGRQPRPSLHTVFGGPFLSLNETEGIHPTSHLDETKGFESLGSSNWTICIPFKSFCSEKTPTFPHSFWEANSYYPTGLIMGKVEFTQLQIGWDSGVSMPGPSNLDHLHPFEPLLFLKFSSFFTFILGGQFLLPQRANIQKREFFRPKK